MAQWSGQFGSGPAFDYIVDINEVGRTASNATLRVQLRLKLHGSNSATFFGYPIDWYCASSGVNSGWQQVKTSARWYGGQDYRSYTADLTIPADNSAKTVGVNVQTRTPGYNLSTGAVNLNYNFTISSRNSPPYWTANDMHINCWDQDIKYDAIIPENTSTLTVTCPTANDNENGGNINYDIHRYVNGNYSAQTKVGGSGRSGGDNIGQWGAGTVFKYEGRINDGELWGDSRWSWTYTKNRFSPATVGNVQKINANQNTFSFTAFTARNQGGICNNSYGYRITSLTPGVNIYGNREVGRDAQENIYFALGIKNNGGAEPTNPHWLDANEIKNYLASSGYTGTIRLRVESWNAYGSSGNADFNVEVDLRKDLGFCTITHTSGWVAHKGTNYYLPAYKPIDLSWTAVTDPMGGTVEYDVLYQIGDGAWTFLGSAGTARTYRASLATAIGNVSHDKFRFIIRARTTYGKQSDSGGPNIALHSYNSPTLRVTKIERNKDNAKITGSLQINTTVPGGTPSLANYSLNSGGQTSFLSAINQGGGNPFSFVFTTTALSMSTSYTLTLTGSDSIKDALTAAGVSISYGTATTNIPVYIPTVSLRKHGIGIGATADTDATLTVGGRIKINGHKLDGLTQSMFSYGQEMTQDEEFAFGLNKLGVYNNTGNGNVVIERVVDNTAPNSTKMALKVTNKGTASPGHGGVSWQNYTYSNGVYTYIITAKIPSGKEIVFAGNTFGDGSKFEWLTPNGGTDKYETYIGRATCGATGTFNTIGYFYINGGSGGFSWYIARANYWDNTRQSGTLRLKTVTIDGNAAVTSFWSERDTLVVAGKKETMLSNNIMFDGVNYIHIDKTKGASQIIMHDNGFPMYRWSNQGTADYGVAQFSSGYEVLTEHPDQGVIKSKPYFQEINRDLNNIIEPGTYPGILTNCSNKPPVGYDFGALLVFTSMGFVIQIWIPHHSSKLCYRLRWGDGNWGGWQATQ